MKNALTYKVAVGCCVGFLYYSASAQQTKAPRLKNQMYHVTDKSMANYQELKNLGYKENEIFEDLGNANFLSQNYETALFWYEKLREASDDGELSRSYQERYEHAQEKMNSTVAVHSEPGSNDWLERVKADYQVERNTQFAAGVSSDEFVARNVERIEGQDIYNTPMALTPDGRTAYFTKTAYEKPLYGIFSKKEQVHKIYKADKVENQLKNVKEVAVCPTNYSALHPTVSEDGKRLFFASDMPGSFGDYDIYVSEINGDGTYGIAKNLGEKVNTKKNDLYPNIVGHNTLFFASEGRKGQGGLDVYMAQVDHKKVGLAVNLGSPINSERDDFSIIFKTEKEMGYVMSNRGNEDDIVREVAFSYAGPENNLPIDKRENNFLAALNNDAQIDYSNSVFEDE